MLLWALNIIKSLQSIKIQQKTNVDNQYLHNLGGSSNPNSFFTHSWFSLCWFSFELCYFQVRYNYRSVHEAEGLGHLGPSFTRHTRAIRLVNTCIILTNPLCGAPAANNHAWLGCLPLLRGDAAVCLVLRVLRTQTLCFLKATSPSAFNATGAREVTHSWLWVHVGSTLSCNMHQMPKGHLVTAYSSGPGYIRGHSSWRTLRMLHISEIGAMR